MNFLIPDSLAAKGRFWSSNITYLLWRFYMVIGNGVHPQSFAVNTATMKESFKDGVLDIRKRSPWRSCRVFLAFGILLEGLCRIARMYWRAFADLPFFFFGYSFSRWLKTVHERWWLPIYQKRTDHVGVFYALLNHLFKDSHAFYP